MFGTALTSLRVWSLAPPRKGEEEVRSNRLLFFFSSLFLSQEAGISLPREHWGPFKPVLKGQLNSPLRLSFSPSLVRAREMSASQTIESAGERGERGYYFSHHAQSARTEQAWPTQRRFLLATKRPSLMMPKP